MTVKKRLGEMLLEAGVIDEAQLNAALGHQRKWGGKLGQALVDLKLATEPEVVAALARKFGYGTANVGAMALTPPLEAALKLVPRELALRQTLLPISSDNSSITVAMADPSNIAVVDELAFRTGRRIRIVLAGDREIASAVRRFYFAEEDPPRPTSISLDEVSVRVPARSPRDPFASMPDHIRGGSPPLVPAGGPRWPAARPPPGSPIAGEHVDIAPELTPPPTLMPLRSPPVTQPAPAPVTGDMLIEEVIAAEPVAPGPAAGDSPRTAARRIALREALERLSRGEEPGHLKAGQLAAAIFRLLASRGIVDEVALLEELHRKP